MRDILVQETFHLNDSLNISSWIQWTTLLSQKKSHKNQPQRSETMSNKECMSLKIIYIKNLSNALLCACSVKYEGNKWPVMFISPPLIFTHQCNGRRIVFKYPHMYTRKRSLTTFSEIVVIIKKTTSTTIETLTQTYKQH